MKRQKGFGLEALSAARGSLLGWATLWVALFHSYHMDFFRARLLTALRLAGPLTRLRETGNCGVDLFLFLSGLGLVYSWTGIRERSAHPLREFYGRRFARVLPAYLTVSLVYYGMTGTEGLHDWLGKIFLYGHYVPGMDGGAYWYFALLFPLYLLFPLLFRPVRRWGTWGALGLIALTVGLTLLLRFAISDWYFDRVEIMLTRVPVFLAGILFGELSRRGTRLPAWAPWAALGLSLPVWFAASSMPPALMPWRRYVYGALTVLIALGYAGVCARLRGRGVVRRCMSAVGALSLEIYLIYENLYVAQPRLLRGADGTGTVRLLTTFVAAALLGALLQVTLNHLRALWEKTGRTPELRPSAAPDAPANPAKEGSR